MTLKSGMKKANIAKGTTASFPNGRKRIAIVYRKVERIYAMKTIGDRDPLDLDRSLVLEGFSRGSDVRDLLVSIMLMTRQ